MSDFVALPVTPEDWLNQMFGSKSAIEGGVVRRKVRDVERLVGRDRFLGLMRARGFRVVENAGHFVVFCSAGPFQICL
jgi:hypothetical protein